MCGTSTDGFRQRVGSVALRRSSGSGETLDVLGTFGEVPSVEKGSFLRLNGEPDVP